MAGSRPNPAGGAYSAPPDPLAGLKGRVREEKWERGRGEGRSEWTGWERRGRRKVWQCLTCVDAHRLELKKLWRLRFVMPAAAWVVSGTDSLLYLLISPFSIRITSVMSWLLVIRHRKWPAHVTNRPQLGPADFGRAAEHLCINDVTLVTC